MKLAEKMKTQAATHSGKFTTVVQLFPAITTSNKRIGILLFKNKMPPFFTYPNPPKQSDSKSTTSRVIYLSSEGGRGGV